MTEEETPEAMLRGGEGGRGRGREEGGEGESMKEEEEGERRTRGMLKGKGR